MKASGKFGFTIIETVLFLGVTGLLIFGILAGTGNSISAQRYKDSVASLYAMLQKQYANVLTVENARNPDWKCDSGGISKPVSGGVSRGKTECVLLGKLITSSNDGGKTSVLKIKNVVGIPGPSYAISNNDVEALTQYSMVVPSDLWQDEYLINWGYSLYNTNRSQMNFSMLILQSPSSGAIRTFINPAAVVGDNAVKSLVSSTYLANELKICVKSAFNSSYDKLGVLVNKGASSANAIERLGDNSGCN